MGALALLALALLCGCSSVVSPVFAEPRDHPRVGAYVGVRSGGQPLVFADGTIDSTTCKAFARFPQVALDLNALLISPNIVPTLIHYSPGIEVSGYHLTTHWHLPASFTTQPGDKSFDAYWHNGIKATNGFISGAPQGYEVNWGQKPTADELSRLLVWGLQRLRLRGYFGDYFSPMVKWAGLGNDFTDQTRIQNMAAAVRMIRGAQQPGFRCYGNGTGAELCGLDGTLVEGFPTASFGKFDIAIKQKDGDWLKSEGAFADKKMQRYALGVSCLTGATLTYGAQEVSPGGQPWPGTWWFDEWSVDENGMPDWTGAHVGWLGQALGAWTKLSSGLYVRYFEHGVDIVNPTGGAITQQMVSARWKRIGSQVPEATVVVPANDAVFLWGE